MVFTVCIAASVFFAVAPLCTAAPTPADVATLRLVQAVWRHGDRASVSTFPTDTSGPDPWRWAGGPGELTELGMQMHYRLGAVVKQRYKGYLSEEYDPRQIHVESSGFNRTIVSALSNMQGLYPAQTTADGKSFWKPIPVYPRSLENEAINPIKPCPNYDKLFAEFAKTQEVQNFLKKNQETFAMLKKESGLKFEDITDINDLQDVLICQTNHPKTNPRPAWVTDAVMNKVLELNDQYWQYLYNDDTRRRLRGGPMLKEMIDRMQDHVKAGGKSPLKYYVFSAHDFTEAALLEALGIYQSIKKAPEYATAVFVELHEKTPGTFTVEVHHKNQTNTENFFPRVVGNCESPCTLEKFRQRSEKFFPANWDVECGLKPVDEYLRFLRR